MLFKKDREREVVVEEEGREIEPVIPEDLTVRVRFRPNTTIGWKNATDVEPPLELVSELFFGDNPKQAEKELINWFKEEYGGGIWRIELLNEHGKTVRSRTLKIQDADITYGVNKWIVYVKGESGKWYKADVEFAHYPTPTEVIDAIGGGGRVRLVGYDERGRIMTSKMMDLGAPIPDWVKEKEDSFEKKITDLLKQKLVEQQEQMIKKLAGNEKKDEDLDNSLNKLIKELEELAESHKLKVVENLVNSLKGEDEKKEKPSLVDVLFVEPYKAKLESVNLLIKKFAERGDIETARQLISEIPDGTGALVNLINAGASLTEALARAISGVSSNRGLKSKLRRAAGRESIDIKEIKEQKRELEKEHEKGEEGTKEEEEEQVAEEREEVGEIKVEETVEDSGWEIKPVLEEG